MRRISASILLLSIAAASAKSQNHHRDYVPDEKTALRIAESVLVGLFGEERSEVNFLYSSTVQTKSSGLCRYPAERMRY
jgi:hypothetical protein